MAWTESELATLKKLASENKYFMSEIARILGRKPQSVCWAARKLGIPSGRITQAHRIGTWNRKHAHLRGEVMEFFLKHTWVLGMKPKKSLASRTQN